jgi:hypothetical protein
MGAIPCGKGIRLRPADALHRLGPRILIPQGENQADAAGGPKRHPCSGWHPRAHGSGGQPAATRAASRSAARAAANAASST